jgi:outer membrane lipoprotein LolB
MNDALRRPFVGISLALLWLQLSACGAVKPRMADVEAVRAQSVHEQATAAQRTFQLRGRIAIRNANDGGSARFAWQQRGDTLDFELSAPLSNQTWRLTGAPGRYVLTDSKGVKRQHSDAKQLIYDASGWNIPLAELSFWIRGARAEGSDADLAFNQSGRLTQLVQNGWSVSYERFVELPDGTRLPAKLAAKKADALVKVVVQSWD